MSISCSVPRVEFPDEFGGSPSDKLNFSFGAREEDVVSLTASEDGLMPSDADDSSVLPPSGVTAQSDAELASGLSGLHCPVLSARGWMIGSWDQSGTLRFHHAPPRFHFSRKCKRRSRSRGRHFSMSEQASQAPPSSLPSVVHATSALHAMAILQVYQAKALKDLHQK